MASACLRIGNKHAAERFLRQALEVDPVSPGVLADLGALLFEQGRVEASERLLERAIELNPAHAAAWCTLGAIHERRGRLAMAQDALNRAVNLAPHLVQAWFNFGYVATRRNDYESALFAYQHAKSQGDYLIASTLSDDLTLRTKGRRPIIPLEQRVEILAGLRCVDEVYVQPTSVREADAAERWIMGLGVHRVVVGGMWRGDAQWVVMQPRLQALGVEVVFAPVTPGVSTTQLRQRIAASAEPSA